MAKSKTDHDYYYHPETNEAGWRCAECHERPGEPPGFSAQLDRELIWLKVGAILVDACNSNLLYVSNSSHGDHLSATVADRCVREGRYDQYSILLFLLEEMTPSHSEYWRDISESILAGADKRDRCHCGKLATIHVGKAHYCSMECQPKMEAA